jgi:hypothetical protein
MCLFSLERLALLKASLLLTFDEAFFDHLLIAEP